MSAGKGGKPSINYAQLNEQLLSQARILLPGWLPGGVARGNEFKAGNLQGDRGTSLSVNIVTGAWADFATGEKGGDMISLYAAIKGLQQHEAALQLGGETFTHPVPNPIPERVKQKVRKVIAPVPPGMGRHHCNTQRFGEPSRVWDYLDADGALLGHVARYDPPGGKEFLPFTVSQGDNGIPYWGTGSWTSPRPLYGLRELAQRPDDPVMIVEGEKAADAARLMCPAYVVVAWPGGAQAWKMADFRPVYRRSTVILWPDNDDPGTRAMWELGHALMKHCPIVKIILPTKHTPDKFDAADAKGLGWKWKHFIEWARPLTKTIGAALSEEKSPAPEPPAAQRGRPMDKPITPSAVGGAEIGGDGILMADIESLNKSALHSALGLDRGSGGVTYCNLNNALKVLELHPDQRGMIWYDDFLQRIMCADIRNDGNGGLIHGAREWQDIDDINMTVYMQRDIGLLKMDKTTASQAVKAVAQVNRKNCVHEWIDSLKWDGVARIGTFFPENFGCEDNEYSRAVSHNFWVSMLARIYIPGCKVDNMVVLEGPQGEKKSTALNIIGGDWYAESQENINSKDFFGTLLGKVLIEIGEMDSFSKGEVTKVKQIVSCRSDRFRAAYGHHAEDHPRQGIFCGTTNRDDWNRDETGARRFWPIRCVGHANIEWITRNRDQLFAEARAALREPGVTWWEMPDDLTRTEQESRLLTDVWTEKTRDFLHGKYSVTVAEILDGLKIETARQDRQSQVRIGSIMRSIGWIRARRRIDGKTQITVYERPEGD